jgi:hypothetical protein
MHQTDRQSSVLTLIQFGYSPARDRLHVRLDADRRMADLLADGYEVALKFLVPAGVRYSVRMTHGQVTGTFWERAGTNGWTNRGALGAVSAAGTILEMTLPLVAVQAAAGDQVAFFVVVLGPDGSEVEAHPAHHPIEAPVPDAQFEARHWTA